jgi:hypothetical protein
VNPAALGMVLADFAATPWDCKNVLYLTDMLNEK